MYRSLLLIAATLLALNSWAGEGSLQGHAQFNASQAKATSSINPGRDHLTARIQPRSQRNTEQASVSGNASPNTTREVLNNLKTDISKIRRDLNIRALAVAIVDESGVVWSEDLSDEPVSQRAPHDPSQLPSEMIPMRFPIAYVSTMFVGLSILRLVEDGRLDLNDRVSELAPEIIFDNPWEVSHPLRLVHLLEHTAGWDSMHFAEFYQADLQAHSLASTLNEYALSRRSRWPPGTRNSNKSIGPAVAAYIVERVSGQSFEQFVAENFFGPIEMRSATYEPNQATVMRDYNVKQSGLKKSRYQALDSIYANTSDMAKFVDFMLQRGQVGGEQILSGAAFNRMEVSLSTLGSEHGAIVAHGLSSSMTGHQNFGVTFYGHRSELSELAYSPELGTGFYISATSDVKGLRIIARKIKTYLLRDREQIAFPINDLPANFSKLDGYYKRVSGFAQRNQFIADLVGITRVRTTESLLMRSPLLGNFETKDYYNGGQALINGWTGLPTIAVVEDPLEGQLMQAWVSFKKVPAVLVFARIIFCVFFTLATVMSFAYFSYRVVEHWRERTWLSTRFFLEAWPLVCGILITSTIILFFFVGDPGSLGQEGMLSLSLFYLSAAYGICAFIGLVMCLCILPFKKFGFASYSACTMSLMHLTFALMLYSYDLIAMRTWTM